MAARSQSLLVLGAGVGVGLLLAQVWRTKQDWINKEVEKQKAKVVHKMSLQTLQEEIKASGKPLVALCRCWKSKKMPYCDGAHAKHNTSTGDNVGPLLIALEG